MIAGVTTGTFAAGGMARANAAAFFAADRIRLRQRVGGGGWGDRGSRPVGHGPCGIRALARPRNRSASGQAAAKARRTRPAVSMTRAAILRSLSLIVGKSAVADTRGFGMASRTVRMSQ